MIAVAFWQQAAVGLAVGLPSLTLGYLGYKRSRRNDKVAEQAGIATTHVASIGQVVDGLNRIITNLQGDNAVLRSELERVRVAVDGCEARLDVLEEKLQAKEREIAALQQEITAVRAENDALKLEIVGLKEAAK